MLNYESPAMPLTSHARLFAESLERHYSGDRFPAQGRGVPQGNAAPCGFRPRIFLIETYLRA